MENESNSEPRIGTSAESPEGRKSDYAVDDFFNRLQSDMRRPDLSQEAISAAFQAIQKLAIESDVEEAVNVVTGKGASPAGLMCPSCSAPIPPGSQFCSSCGIPRARKAQCSLRRSPVRITTTIIITTTTFRARALGRKTPQRIFLLPALDRLQAEKRIVLEPWAPQPD